MVVVEYLESEHSPLLSHHGSNNARAISAVQAMADGSS